MSDNKNQKSFIVGGSLEKALSGDYQLPVSTVIKETIQVMWKNLFSFLPSVIFLICIQVIIFWLSLKIQVGEPRLLFQALISGNNFTTDMLDNLIIANVSAEILSAPIYAGVSLMAMSHAIGLKTKPRHILKGMNFLIPVTISMMLLTLIEGAGNAIFPIIGLYLTMSLSFVILLVCERRMRPFQAVVTSVRVVTRKIIPLTGIFLVALIFFLSAIPTMGISLILAFPFFFTLKGVLYRRIFGVNVQIVGEVNANDEHKQPVDQYTNEEYSNSGKTDVDSSATSDYSESDSTAVDSETKEPENNQRPPKSPQGGNQGTSGNQSAGGSNTFDA
ncbi:hypothetical protein L0B53_13970 [Vibrio sp. SS-MA-C1-2]|uniref:hypothetical protein n=1 Tax=Vibrio sp. SS-MA-C1-2 TaxID=2908646 RepID=UPI001F2A4082|nr:hypothetical protein [Vibrio sp. SS-MA-C1-2]UJF18120.1 hypothetical protein L0B53_13970 [Vibrio sp. SS-MA-C1-2]